jgi:ABC-2 type transport system ATP-binding protein
MLPGVSLEFDHITKRFGATVALDDLAFEVPRGRIFGFLGANGAGKTTTMRICLGILRPDTGTVRWEGTPTAALPRRTWGYLPEERGLYARMPVLDQLVYFASLYGQPRDVARRDALQWLRRFRIPDYATRRAEELSKGNQQKVQFIAAVLHAPSVLLMDEPFTGLDPVNLGLLREAFLELRDEGRTIVFSTHQMEAAEALCESLAIVDRGRIVAQGTLSELKRASRARTVRLGVEGETLPGWLAGLPGVVAVRPGAGFAELELAAGSEPAAVLTAAVNRGAAVTRFEVAEPSLEAIFVERVGRAADDEERTLAPDEPVAGTAAGAAPATASDEAAA